MESPNVMEPCCRDPRPRLHDRRRPGCRLRPFRDRHRRPRRSRRPPRTRTNPSRWWTPMVEAYGQVVSEEVINNASETTSRPPDLRGRSCSRSSRELDAQVAENPDDTALLAQRDSTKKALRGCRRSHQVDRDRTPCSMAPASSSMCRHSPRRIQIAPRPAAQRRNRFRARRPRRRGLRLVASGAGPACGHQGCASAHPRRTAPRFGARLLAPPRRGHRHPPSPIPILRPRRPTTSPCRRCRSPSARSRDGRWSSPRPDPETARR